MCKAPVLAYPRWNLPFILQCDASDTGLGVVLTQIYEDKEHPIAYYSRKFSTAETKYAIMERECLAIVDGIKHFRAYLYGYRFLVVTDHKPLEHMDTFKAHNGRVARWRMSLSDYNYDVVARPGHLNGNADALSRFALNSINFTTNTITFTEQFPEAKNPKQIRSYQREDEYFRTIMDYLELGILPTNDNYARSIIFQSELFHTCKGVLYHIFEPSKRHRITTRLRLAIPTAMKLKILNCYHNDPLSVGSEACRSAYPPRQVRIFFEGRSRVSF